MDVILSIAHTATAPGAASKDGEITEHPYSRRICEAAAEVLRAAGLEVEIISGTIRQKIGAIKKASPVLCVVEPHLNAAVNDSARGHLTIHTRGEDEERLLAISITEAMDGAFRSELDYRPRRIGPVEVPGPYVHHADLPLVSDKDFLAVIVEPAFLSNQQDLEVLKRPETAGVLGQAIARGVLAWIRRECA